MSNESSIRAIWENTASCGAEIKSAMLGTNADEVSFNFSDDAVIAAQRKQTECTKSNKKFRDYLQWLFWKR